MSIPHFSGKVVWAFLFSGLDKRFSGFCNGPYMPCPCGFSIHFPALPRQHSAREQRLGGLVGADQLFDNRRVIERRPQS